MNRVTLKSDFSTANEALELINDIYDKFYKEFNKNPISELYFSSFGSKDKPQYAIVIYYENEQVDEYSYFKNIIDL